MRLVSNCLILSLSILLVNYNLILAEDKAFGSSIIIHNNSHDTANWATDNGYMKLNVGPSVGNCLNVHYFPAVADYARGNYFGTLQEMNYILDRPWCVKVNPRGLQYLSAGHYMRGMIYIYHASGDGRHVKAKNDFEQAIRWDQSNHYAYLELARVHAAMGSRDRAINVLKQLIESKPPEELVRQAGQLLNTWQLENATKRSDKRNTQSSQSSR